MKKIIVILLVVCIAVVACGCGNMSLGIGNYTFKKVHIAMPNTQGCFTIHEWYDNETGIEVTTKEAGSMYLSEGTYVLIKENCPFCEE